MYEIASNKCTYSHTHTSDQRWSLRSLVLLTSLMQTVTLQTTQIPILITEDNYRATQKVNNYYFSSTIPCLLSKLCYTAILVLYFFSGSRKEVHTYGWRSKIRALLKSLSTCSNNNTIIPVKHFAFPHMFCLADTHTNPTVIILSWSELTIFSPIS